MSDFLDRAKRYHVAIQKILLNDWDPIGIVGVFQAKDEYDGYVPEIHAILIRHASKQQLIDHLWWIETVHMGLCGNRGKTEAIAEQLLSVRDEMECELK